MNINRYKQFFKGSLDKIKSIDILDKIQRHKPVKLPNLDWIEHQRHTRMEEDDVEEILTTFKKARMIRSWHRNLNPLFSGVEDKLWSVTDLSGWEFQLGPEFTAYSFIKATIDKFSPATPGTWDNLINDIREGK